MYMVQLTNLSQLKIQMMKDDKSLNESVDNYFIDTLFLFNSLRENCIKEI